MGAAGLVLVLCPQEKKRRREENLKRRLENERKAEIVQVVSAVGRGLGAGGAGVKVVASALPRELEEPGEVPRSIRLSCSALPPA